MSEAGWFDDPSGRFGKRWYDGTAWSGHVVGANGTVTSDALPDRAEPYPPPVRVSAPPLASPGPAPHPLGYGPPGYGPSGYGSGFGPGFRPRYRPGLGIVFAAIGLVAVAVSLFGPSWIKGGDASFLKLAENARNSALPDDADGDVVIAYAYLVWAGFLLFGLSIVLAVAGLVPVPPTSHGVSRIVGSVVAGAAGILHAATFGQIASDERSAAVYVGFGGYYVLLLGFVVGVREVGAVKLTGKHPASGVPT